MTHPEQDRKRIENLQSSRLVASVKAFIKKNQNAVIITPSFHREAKNFLLAIEHTLKTSNSNTTNHSMLKDIFNQLVQLVTDMNSLRSTHLHEHHLTALKEVTVEKVERLQQLKKGEGKPKHMNDTISAERIQTLLQDQKDMYTKELEDEQRNQVVLLRELSELTSVLKETTIDINSAVNLQNTQLTDMQKFAEENQQELESQKKKMNQRTKSMTSSVWTGFGMMMWIIALFVATYVVIRIIPKPTSERTCHI